MLLALRGEVGHLRQEERTISPLVWSPGSCCPAWTSPSPLPHWSLSPSLGFHGDQEADSSVEEEAVSKATCNCTNWLGLKSSGYQGRGLGQRGGLLGFPPQEPGTSQSLVSPGPCRNGKGGGYHHIDAVH